MSGDDDPELALIDLYCRIFVAVWYLEEQIGIKPGLILDLEHETDDWSFTIKLRALFEAAVNEFIDCFLGDFGTIHRLPFRQRLDLAKELNKGVFKKSTVVLLEQITTLRNRYGHDIHHHGLTITDYFERNEPEAGARLKKHLAPENPLGSGLRGRIWFSSLVELGRIYIAILLRASDETVTAKSIRNWIESIPVFWRDMEGGHPYPSEFVRFQVKLEQFHQERRIRAEDSRE